MWKDHARIYAEVILCVMVLAFLDWWELRQKPHLEVLYFPNGIPEQAAPSVSDEPGLHVVPDPQESEE